MLRHQDQNTPLSVRSKPKEEELISFEDMNVYDSRDKRTAKKVHLEVLSILDGLSIDCTKRYQQERIRQGHSIKRTKNLIGFSKSEDHAILLH